MTKLLVCILDQYLGELHRETTAHTKKKEHGIWNQIAMEPNTCQCFLVTVWQ